MIKVALRLHTMECIRLNRADLRRATGLLTGHLIFRRHLHKMGLRCRLCEGAAGTAQHVGYDCPVLDKKQFESPGTLRRGGEK